MVEIAGPKFRSAKIYPNRKLKFNLDRDLPFGKKGVVFRKTGVKFRKCSVNFGNDGVSNIDIGVKEDPIKINNEGVKYYNNGKYKTALRYFNKALAVAPQFEMARTNRLYCIKMIRQQEAEVQQRRKLVTTSLAKTKTAFKEPVTVQPSDYGYNKYSQQDQYSPNPKKHGTKAIHTLYDYNHPPAMDYEKWRY